MKVGYARVSTKDQESFLQHDALTEAGCERIFDEKASGAQRDRPELIKAIEYLRAGDTLVTWKLDRLARSLRQLIETVEDLQDRGIGFISLTEGIDTTSAGGKLIFHVFGALAEFEKSLIQERTVAGLKAAKARGRKLGRPAALTESQIKMARSMKSAGNHSMVEIAKQLGVSRATLYRAFGGEFSGVGGEAELEQILREGDTESVMAQTRARAKKLGWLSDEAIERFYGKE